MVVDRFGLMGHRLSRPTPSLPSRQHKADGRSDHTDRRHLEGHHDLLSEVAKIEKDRLARLRKGRLTGVTAKETSFAACVRYVATSTHVPLLVGVIMRAPRIGARLPPLV